MSGPKSSSGVFSLPLNWLRRDTLLALLSRFSLVGFAATATYLAVSNALMVSGMLEPVTASVLGYVAGMAVSFLGQSGFTFSVHQRTFSQLFRFTLLSVAGIAFSWWSVEFVVHEMRAHPVWGTVATSAFIPLLSFIVMRNWIFARSEPKAK
ncbi:GtrA family protein [Chelativorans alearense]|uniref:GtrA family protein n=1 Tax=Chelativorans alearense TaxID=2681495 RepID=UPI0013D3E4A0|nr:GtrA family protein [Chelativorans alearense]